MLIAAPSLRRSVSVHGSAADRIGAPDQLEQLFAAVDATGIAEQRAQQVELAVRELHLAPRDRAAPRIEVELEPARAQHRLLGREAAGPAQLGA
jgi:hypothetical protein